MMKRPQAARPISTGKRLTTAEVKKYVNAEPWVYYDTLILSANTVPPASAAVNFAQFSATTQFFGTRSFGNATFAITNMSDTQKMEADFLCDSIAVDVHCDTDCASAAGISTAQAFVEEIVNYGVIQLLFGVDTRLVAPVSRFPAGGGMYSSTKIRTQAAGANSDSATATNGFPSATAKQKLREPILFKRGSAFTCNLIVPSSTNSTLARIQAIQALTGTFQALIRINLEGVRGRPLLESAASR